MMISVIFAIGFVFFASQTKNIVILTLIYGVVIWIVGPLVIRPLMLGVGTNLANAFAPDQLMSLGTHIFFSIIVAIVYTILNKQSINA